MNNDVSITKQPTRVRRLLHRILGSIVACVIVAAPVLVPSRAEATTYSVSGPITRAYVNYYQGDVGGTVVIDGRLIYFGSPYGCDYFDASLLPFLRTLQKTGDEVAVAYEVTNNQRCMVVLSLLYE
jgi:hypothetical protein